MTAEHHCPECKLAELIQKGENFRHRYGMIAVNFGPPFILRKCATKEEKSVNLEPNCDRPQEFVAKTEDIG